MLKEQLFIVELVPASFLETELFSPPSLFFCTTDQNKSKSYSLGLQFYITSSGSKFKKN